MLLYETVVPGMGTSEGTEEILEEVGVGMGQPLGRAPFDYRKREGALGRRKP